MNLIGARLVSLGAAGWRLAMVRAGLKARAPATAAAGAGRGQEIFGEGATS